MPTNYLEVIGISALVAENKTSLGLTFLFSGATTTGYFLIYIANNWPSIIRPIATRISISKKIKTLTPLVKQYLQAYITNNAQTQHFSYEDGVVGGLTLSSVIFRSAGAGSLWESFAYNIHPYAKKKSQDNPKLLEGAAGTIGSARQRNNYF